MSGMSGDLTRRRLMIGGAGALAALTLAERASAQASPDDASPAAGGWSYTDFLGRVVELPAAPIGIAAEIGGAAALYDLGVQVHSVWGSPANDPEGYREAWGRLPVDSVVNISTGDGQPDPEKALAEETDLFVLGSTDLVNVESYGGHDQYVPLLQEIAPIAAWPFRNRLDETVAGIWDLAIALGADPESASNVAAREAYDAAVAELQAILAEKPGLTTFFGYPLATELYVANPDLWDDVNFFRYLGLDVAFDEELADSWWEVLSWEQALKHETDTAFLANVSGALTLEEIEAHPTFGLHPAVQAKQVGVWSWYFARSPQGITTLVENITEVVRTAEKVTG